MLDVNNLDEAERYLNEVVKNHFQLLNDYRRAVLFSGFGRLNFSRGNYREAERNFLDSYNIRQDVRDYLWLGVVLKKEGRPKEAQQIFTAIIQNTPADSPWNGEAKKHMEGLKAE